MNKVKDEYNCKTYTCSTDIVNDLGHNNDVVKTPLQTICYFAESCWFSICVLGTM